MAGYPKGAYHSSGSVTMGSTFNSLVGLIILALDIWAIINVLKSGAETGMKVLWGAIDPVVAGFGPDHLGDCRAAGNVRI